ncbi:hypothetical protein V8E54_007042 [Elaphomyces granulatus]
MHSSIIEHTNLSNTLNFILQALDSFNVRFILVFGIISICRVMMHDAYFNLRFLYKSLYFVFQRVILTFDIHSSNCFGV